MQHGIQKATSLKGYGEHQRNEIKVPDEPRGHRAKKNRKRWCGGKEGQEHDAELRINYWDVNTPQTVARMITWLKDERDRYLSEANYCKRCGKRIDFGKRLSPERARFLIDVLSKLYT